MPCGRKHPLSFILHWSLGTMVGVLVVGCQVNVPMKRLLLNGPATPTRLSSGLTPPLRLTVPEEYGDTAPSEDEDSPELIRTSHQEKAEDGPAEIALPRGMTLPDAEAAALATPKGVVVNLDTVLRLTCEHNGDILVARERVNESQAALDAAMRSCMPEMLRKDTFKKPVAEALVWRRRAELRKVENDNLQDAANTYIDWLTALRGEAVTRDLLGHEEKLQARLRKLVKPGEKSGEKAAQAILEAAEAALEGRRLFIVRTHQQGEAAAAKLAYLMGLNGPLPLTKETLEPIDRVDVSTPVEVLVRQAQENGPGVRELQGLAASIQQGIASARGAQCLCEHTGAALVCGRLQMAQSQLQQAQLSLFSLQTKLRAGVEEALSAIHSGREQIARATESIHHASETYRLTDLRLREEGPEENRRNNTYNAVLTSIQQLSQTHANYLTAVSNYNKAQARLLLLLGTYNECHTPSGP
jgi:hypothetical protein